MDGAIDDFLAEARGGGFRLERVARAHFEEPGRLEALHAFSETLMAEPFGHFAGHALTNDELHVFRRRGSGAIAGFQFWRTFGGEGGLARVVLGGKLRIEPSARRHGLHLASGLRVLTAQRRLYPHERTVRLGIVSLFGFVSLARRLAHYEFVDAAGPRRDLVSLVHQAIRPSGYRFDPETGLVSVGIRVTPETLASYPAEFFERREARAYLARNPDFAQNSCYLAFVFEPEESNVSALARGAAEGACGRGAAAERWASALLEAWRA